MTDLIELINIVGPKGKEAERQIKALTKDHNIGQLYEGIRRGKYQSEEEAARVIFGKTPHAAKYYNNLKHRLLNKLTSLVLFVDFGKTEVQKAYFYCYKRFAVVKILIGVRAKQIAIKIAEKTLTKAIKYEFSELAMLLANELQLHYSAIVGDRHKFKKYSELTKKYLEITHGECLAQTYYSEVVFDFSKSRTTKKEFAERSIRYIQELKPFKEKIETYRFNLFYYNILVSGYQHTNDYAGIIEVCQSALSFFAGKGKQVPYVAFFSFLIKKASAHINLKQFEEGKKDLDKCTSLPSEGSYNWHVALIYKVLLNFHSGDYGPNQDVLMEAKKHMKNIPENLVEQWLIIEAYIKLFMSIGLIDQVNGQRFRLGKFLNEVPIYSKDKRGNNVSILILQILFLLEQGKTGKIIDRIDALQRYNRRHLINDDTFRSNCFINMLIQLPAGYFNRQAVERKTARDFDKLKSVPIDVAKQAGELEIVPYEKLWEIVLDLL